MTGAQEPTESARTVKVTLRLTPSEAALVDAARGTAERAAWMRQAVLAAAGPAPKRKAGNCRHEGLRLTKGICPDCGTWAVRK